MKCLACDTELDGHLAHGFDPEVLPEDGDISMCIYCGALAFYVVTDGVMTLRQPTGEETRALILDGYVQEMLQKRKELMAGFGSEK